MDQDGLDITISLQDTGWVDVRAIGLGIGAIGLLDVGLGAGARRAEHHIVWGVHLQKGIQTPMTRGLSTKSPR